MYDLIGAHPNYGQSAQHANAHALAHRHHHTGGGLDDVKAWLDKTTHIPVINKDVENKYLVLAALAAGVGYYGYTKGWFR